MHDLRSQTLTRPPQYSELEETGTGEEKSVSEGKEELGDI